MSCLKLHLYAASISALNELRLFITSVITDHLKVILTARRYHQCSENTTKSPPPDQLLLAADPPTVVITWTTEDYARA